MRCQDVERLILEAGERELSGEERAEVEQHLAQCAACASFRDFRQGLQNGFRKAVPPTLPVELDERVRLACRAELKARLESAAGRRSAPVPWPIWAALGVLTILTLAVLIPGLEEFRQDQKLTTGVALALGILLQNALALFFAPVIMRRRPFSRGLEESSNDALSV